MHEKRCSKITNRAYGHLEKYLEIVYLDRVLGSSHRLRSICINMKTTINTNDLIIDLVVDRMIDINAFPQNIPLEDF